MSECKRGHDLAVHGRPKPLRQHGRCWMTTICVVCRRERRHAQKAAHAEILATTAPVEEAWARFCAELPERIAAIRATEGTDGWPGDAPETPYAPERPPAALHGLRMVKRACGVARGPDGRFQRKAS